MNRTSLAQRTARLRRQTENAHHLGQLGRLVTQAVGSGGALFHQRCVLLGHLVQLGDGFAHLADAGGLLVALEISPIKILISRATPATRWSRLRTLPATTATA